MIGGLRRESGDLIRRWNIPDGRAIGRDPDGFLRLLAGPTWICLNGQDPSRTRAVTTLLHGNEPSGTRALHRFLLSEQQPATNVMALVASVEAALAPPGFAHRMLPGRKADPATMSRTLDRVLGSWRFESTWGWDFPLIAMTAETMIPEAFHGSPQFNGLLLVIGFVALLILMVLGH